MTAILLSEIPSNINTLEQLHVYTSIALASLNPTRQILETENTTDFVCRYFVAMAYEGSTRIVDRVSVPLDPAYLSDKSKKFWEFAQEISQTTLPATYKSN